MIFPKFYTINYKHTKLAFLTLDFYQNCFRLLSLSLQYLGVPNCSTIALHRYQKLRKWYLLSQKLPMRSKTQCAIVLKYAENQRNQ